MHEPRIGLRGLADARPGPVDEVGRDADDAFVLYRGDRGPAGSRDDLFRLGGIVRVGEDDDLRIAPQDLLRRELRVRARSPCRDVLAARDLDQVMDVRPRPDCEDLGGIGSVDLVIDARLGRRRRRLRSDVVDALLDVASYRLAVAADGSAQKDGGACNVSDGLRIDHEHEKPGAGQSFDRAIGELHAEDEVGPERNDLLEVHLDAADLLELLRGGRLVREVIHTNDPRSGAEREEEFGDRRADGDDALRALWNGDGAVLEIGERGGERDGGYGRAGLLGRGWRGGDGGAAGRGHEEEDGEDPRE